MSIRTRPYCLLFCFAAVISPLASFATADESDKDATAKRADSVRKAISFLISQQRENGAFNPETGTAVTSLATTALVRVGRPATDPAVAKAIRYILSHQQKDGGIYDTRLKFKNYETCLATMCLAELNADGKYNDVIAKADRFLKQLQWDASESVDVSHESYGGGGYGKHQRPDLSNTAFLIEALRAAGNDENSEAIQRALIFVSRSQNLESEHNKTAFAAVENDGGFYYTPAAGAPARLG